MNAKVKSGIILFITLLIGFVIGFLTSSRVKENRIKELRSFGSPEGFRFMMENMLELDSEQKAAIRPVFDKYAKKNFELMKDFRGEFKELMVEFHSELTPHLTPQQIEKLKKFGKRGREMEKRGKYPRKDRKYGPRSSPDHDGDDENSRRGFYRYHDW